MLVPRGQYPAGAEPVKMAAVEASLRMRVEWRLAQGVPAA